MAAAAAAAIAAVGSADSLECLMCVRGDLGDDALRNEIPTSLPRLLEPRMDVLIEIGPLPLAGVTDRDGDEPTPERSSFLLFMPVVPLDLFILLNPRSPPPPWVGASSDTCSHHKERGTMSASALLPMCLSEQKRSERVSGSKRSNYSENRTSKEHDSCDLAIPSSVPHALVV